jgi:hypothetical protein
MESLAGKLFTLAKNSNKPSTWLVEEMADHAASYYSRLGFTKSAISQLVKNARMLNIK